MEEKKFIVTILSKDIQNGDVYFNGTINSFLDNTNFPQKIHIHIYHNGSYSSPIVQSISDFVLKWQDKAQFSFRVGGEDRGIKFGIDMINEWAGEYKYSLFLSAKWMTLPENKDWLIDSLNLMDKEELDQLNLYPYPTDNENVEKIKNGVAFLKNFEYTNKPHIHKNKTFFDNGIFPIQEYDNQPKPLKSAWLVDKTMVSCKDFLQKLEEMDND